MKIIITESFDKKYLKKLSKYFSTDDFIHKLKQASTITLKYPYFKLKMKLRMVEFRWVTLIQQWNYLIPLFIHLKKDKKHWENIIWSKYESTILDAQATTLKEIKNNQYKIY